MEEKQIDDILERLDKLIRITALSSTRGLTSTEKISLLNQAGFRPKEISEIIGTTQNVVNVRLSQIRKRGRIYPKKENEHDLMSKENNSSAHKKI